MPVEIGGATIKVEGITISTDVIFAQPGSPSQVGGVALDTADLGVNTKMRKLICLDGPDMLPCEQAAPASSPTQPGQPLSRQEWQRWSWTRPA